MDTGVVHQPRPAAPIASLAAWAAAALLAGCLLALAGMAGIYALLALATLIVFGVAAARYPGPAMAASLWCLGLCPFVWGVKSGVLPKLFGDEVLLLLYLVCLPFFYLSGARTWRRGYHWLYAALVFYLGAESLSFAIFPKDLIAYRNFLETSVLGAMLLVLFLQEGAEAETEMLGNAVAWLTAAIAALSLVERVAQRNPIMEHVTDIPYMSAQLMQLTQGAYRPYVSFFHPSEAAAFMALGAPFAIRRWMRTQSAASAAALAVIAGGLFVNATRGAWVAVAAAMLLLGRDIWKALVAAAAAAGVGALVAIAGFRNSPFMQRMLNPNNLYTRFEYWGVALRAFADHPLIGVGHMQFRQVYLAYIGDIDTAAHVDLVKVYVVDNMYLTTLVEHGVVGSIAFLGLLLLIAALLLRHRRDLANRGLAAEASFVRSAEMALVAYAVTGFFADINLFTKATKYFFILAGLGLAAGCRPSKPAARSRIAAVEERR